MTIKDDKNFRRIWHGGFSLIELIVAISMLVILTGLMTPNLTHFVGEQRAKACIRDRQDIADVYNTLILDPDTTSSQQALRDAIEMAGFAPKYPGEDLITDITDNCKSKGDYSIEYDGERPAHIICSYGHDHDVVDLSGEATKPAETEDLGGIDTPEEKPEPAPLPPMEETDIEGRIEYIWVDATPAGGTEGGAAGTSNAQLNSTVGTTSTAVNVWAKMYGSTATKKVPASKVNWMVGSTTTATIALNEVTALSVGSTLMTATYHNCKATMQVNVTDSTKVTKVVIVDENDEEIEEVRSPDDGSAIQLYALVTYSNNVTKKESVNWSSTNSWSARVTSSGKIYFEHHNAGQEIRETITAEKGGESASVPVIITASMLYNNAASVKIVEVNPGTTPLQLHAEVTTVDGKPYLGAIDWFTGWSNTAKLTVLSNGDCIVRYTGTAVMTIKATVDGPNSSRPYDEFQTNGNIILYPTSVYGAVGDADVQMYYVTYSNNITPLNNADSAHISVGDTDIATYTDGKIHFKGEGSTTLEVIIKGARTEIPIVSKKRYVITEEEKAAVAALKTELGLADDAVIPIGYAKDLRAVLKDHFSKNEQQVYNTNDQWSRAPNVWTINTPPYNTDLIYVYNGEYYLMRYDQNIRFGMWDEEGNTTLGDYIKTNKECFIKMGTVHHEDTNADIRWTVGPYKEGDIFVFQNRDVYQCITSTSSSVNWVKIN